MKAQRDIYGLAGGAIIVALTVLIYYHAFFNGFVSDDGFQILNNLWIKDIRFIPDIFGHSIAGAMGHNFQQATYRPLMYVVFMLEYALFGLNAAGWHVVNVLVHAINGVLVFFIAASLLRSFGTGGGRGDDGAQKSLGPSAIWLMALTAGALFVSHPAGSEPVSWISALPELAFTLLTLLAFYLHIYSDKRGGESAGGKAALAGYVSGPVLFFLGLLFKETAIVLPVFIFIYDIISKRAKRASGGEGANKGHRTQWVKEVFDKKALFIYGGYGLAFAVYMVFRILALGHLTPDTNLNAYLGIGGLLLNAAAGFYKAMFMLFSPMGQGGYPFQIFKALTSPFEVRAILALSFTMVFFFSLFLFRKKLHPIVLISVAFMILPVLPALYSPVVSRFDIAPRYIYLSSAGYAFVTVFFLRWLFHSGPFRGKFVPAGIGVGLSWVLILLCAFASAGMSRDWVDNMSLAKAALRGSADNYFALYQIGNNEVVRGSYSEAIKSYERAVEIIDRQEHPDYQTMREALLGLGLRYIDSGRTDDAMRAYEKVLRFYPGNATAAYGLGYLSQERGSCEKAIYYYGRAFSSYTRPVDKSDTLLNMGNCYASLGRYDMAMKSYREALGITPGNGAVLRNMETVKRRMRQSISDGRKP